VAPNHSFALIADGTLCFFLFFSLYLNIAFVPSWQELHWFGTKFDQLKKFMAAAMMSPTRIDPHQS
jgi:hypothetical protein